MSKFIKKDFTIELKSLALDTSDITSIESLLHTLLDDGGSAVSESDPDDSEIIRILLAGSFGVLWYLALSDASLPSCSIGFPLESNTLKCYHIFFNYSIYIYSQF